jgi:hypothetical protein
MGEDVPPCAAIQTLAYADLAVRRAGGGAVVAVAPAIYTTRRALGAATLASGVPDGLASRAHNSTARENEWSGHGVSHGESDDRSRRQTRLGARLGDAESVWRVLVVTLI